MHSETLDDSSFEKIIHFNPLQYIESASERDGKTDYLVYNRWKVFMTALALPGGKDWLIQQGSQLPEDAKTLEYLMHLAKSCLTIKEKTNIFPDVVSTVIHHELDHSRQDTATLAATAALAALTGNQETYEKLSWSINALRNHLDPVEQINEFVSLEKRLLKVGVWARRCSKPGRLSKILPMLKKSPFRALKMGLMGADGLTGNDQKIKIHRAKPEHIEHAIHHLVDRIQGAARLKLFNGSRFGLNTKGAGLVVSNVLSMMIFRLKLGLLALRLRTAGLEIAMPPYNLELMIYSSRDHLLQASAGAALGPELGVARATLGLEINPLSIEQQNAQGIVLRMPRVRGHEEQLRIRFKAMISDLLDWSIQADREKKMAPGELLKKLMGKYPELSISQIGKYQQKKQSHSIGLEAGFAVKAASSGISAIADSKLEFFSSIRRFYEDQKGAIHVKKIFKGRQLKGSSGVELSARLVDSRENTDVNSSSLTFWSHGVDWMSAGRDVRSDVVYNEGLLHEMSFIEVQFQSQQDFIKSVLNNMNDWVQTRAKQKNIQPEIAHQHIQTFLTEIKNQGHAVKSYAIRAEIKAEAVKQVNRLHFLIGLLEAQTIQKPVGLINSLNNRVNEILDNPHSWEPTSFRVFERHDQSQYKGLSFLLSRHSVTGAEGVHAQARLM